MIVLGMHRSGTSCLTGLLQQRGLCLGTVVEEAPHNRKGNRENLGIVALNDAILATSGGSWDDPPEALRWSEEQRRARDNIVRQFSETNAWGFKDPRVVLTLPFWLEGLQDSHVHIIATYRHPFAVAWSLRARQPDITIKRGLKLWQQYNERLLAYRHQRHFPLIKFDLDATAYLRSALSAIDSLHLPPPMENAAPDFFNDELRHHHFSDAMWQLEFEGSDAPQVEPLIALYQALEALS